MSSSYSGVATGLAERTDPVQVTVPTDGDSLTAASITASVKRLADWLKKHQDSAGFIALAQTWALAQRFTSLARFDAGVDSYADVNLKGSHPASGTSFLNAVGPGNTIKCAGRIHILGDAIQPDSYGYNCTLAMTVGSVGATWPTVTILQDMANADYEVVCSGAEYTDGATLKIPAVVGVQAQAAGSFELDAWWMANSTTKQTLQGLMGANSNQFWLNFAVLGAQ